MSGQTTSVLDKGYLPFLLALAPKLALPDFGVVLEPLLPVASLDSAITRSPSCIS